MTNEEIEWAKQYKVNSIVEIKIENDTEWQDAKVISKKIITKKHFKRYEIRVSTISNGYEWQIHYDNGLADKAIRNKQTPRTHNFF